MKPILFSTPMVQAILDGRKTMTRRGIRPQPRHVYDDYMGGWDCCTEGHCHLCEPKPPYKPGDILWVRETWFENEECLLYKASKYENTKEYHGRNGWVQIKWRPSIFMPREAARIFLRVTNVRVERLQDITEEDAIAEGFCKGMQFCGENSSAAHTARQAYMWYWDILNVKRGYGWSVNPWVWVISFERISEQEAKEHDRS
jgi:hypothetical protein